MTTPKARQYWLDTLRGWAEDRLSEPQFAECSAVLDELDIIADAHEESLRTLQSMLKRAGYKSERTDDLYSIASTKFIVTKPDGSAEDVWSPPWHQLDDKAEEICVMLASALGLVKKD